MDKSDTNAEEKRVAEYCFANLNNESKKIFYDTFSNKSKIFFEYAIISICYSENRLSKMHIEYENVMKYLHDLIFNEIGGE